MKSHLQNLMNHVPNLLERRILDLGSGKGNFLLDVAKEEGDVYGLEKNKEYINETLKKAKENNLSIEVRESVAEELPFQDGDFGFINISEVIEHVENPDKVIGEIYRVLQPSGFVYMSVPSRFSIKDPHFHLYFVNWLPRFMSDAFISLFGEHKNYAENTGEQRLKEMHYYKFNEIKRKLVDKGLVVIDIREKRIREKVPAKLIEYLLLFIYRTIRPFYFSTFHLLIRKK